MDMMQFMASARSIIEKITEALRKKVGDRELRCPICQHEQWQIPPSFVPLTLKKSPRSFQLGDTVLPTVPLICTNCGNTQLINLRVLGIEDWESLRFDDAANQPL